MKQEDLMALPVSTLVSESRAFAPDARVSEVMGFLKESNSYEALVDEGAKTSIIMIRDMLDITSLDTKVSALMHQVPRLNQNNSVGDAAALMFEYRARSMPVYQGNDLKGVVTSPSIVAKLMDSPQKIRVSSLMSAEPITIESSSPVSMARDLMMRKKIDQVPIVDAGKVRGVITSGDIVFNLMPGSDMTKMSSLKRRRFTEPVGQFTLDDAPTSDITEPLDAVYLSLSKRRANYCLIMNTGELQGILTYRDFMRTLLRRSTGPSLPMYIVGLPDDPFEATTVRTKFNDAVSLLKKAFPDISEARAVIKSRNTRAAKKRSEVRILILSPRQRYSYSVNSFGLADAFDQVHLWAKKTVSEYKPNKRRKMEAPQFPE